MIQAPSGAKAEKFLSSTRVSKGAGFSFEISEIYDMEFGAARDMGKLDAWFDKRAAADADFAKAVQGGLTKVAFRKYYALRASSTVSRGAHDEWNIFRSINERRRADSKFGTPGQIPMLFDGEALAPPQGEAQVSEGYVGKCAAP